MISIQPTSLRFGKFYIDDSQGAFPKHWATDILKAANGHKKDFDELEADGYDVTLSPGKPRNNAEPETYFINLISHSSGEKAQSFESTVKFKPQSQMNVIAHMAKVLVGSLKIKAEVLAKLDEILLRQDVANNDTGTGASPEEMADPNSQFWARHIAAEFSEPSDTPPADDKQG